MNLSKFFTSLKCLATTLHDVECIVSASDFLFRMTMKFMAISIHTLIG